VHVTALYTSSCRNVGLDLCLEHDYTKQRNDVNWKRLTVGSKPPR